MAGLAHGEIRTAPWGVRIFAGLFFEIENRDVADSHASGFVVAGDHHTGVIRGHDGISVIPELKERLFAIQIEQEGRAGLEMAPYAREGLGESGQVRNVVQAFKNGICAIEPAPEREVAYVGDGEWDNRRIPFRECDHRAGGVESGHFKAALPHHLGKLSGSAADIENGRVPRNPRQEQALDDGQNARAIFFAPIAVVNGREGIVFAVAFDFQSAIVLRSRIA